MGSVRPCAQNRYNRDPIFRPKIAAGYLGNNAKHP